MTYTVSTQAELKLSLSTLCNMDCSYCFRPKDKVEKTDVEIAQKSIDFMMKKVRQDAKGFSICVNMTSEPMVEIEAMEQIQKYITQKGSMLFETEDFDDFRFPWDLLDVLPICLTKEFNDPLRQDFEGAVAYLNQIISEPDMAKQIPMMPGMSLPPQEAKEFFETAKMTPKNLRGFNCRFLALIFPHLNWYKQYVTMSCISNGTIYNERVLAFIKKWETVFA